MVESEDPRDCLDRPVPQVYVDQWDLKEMLVLLDLRDLLEDHQEVLP